MKLGRSLEMDVATLDEDGGGPAGNGIAVWAPPRPGLRTALPTAPAEVFEVQVLEDSAGPRLVAVDVVTERRANLHHELLTLLGLPQSEQGPPAPELYAAAYRTWPGETALELEAWLEPLRLGERLPQVPLWLGPDRCLPLDLEATYALACSARRIALR